jgi:hypothetical protein
MRNYFAIAFIIVYLILTVGVAKSTHYCMGRLNNTTFFSFESKKCPCALFQAAIASCCHDESELIKLEDDQQSQLAIQVNSPSFFLIELLVFDPTNCVLLFDRPRAGLNAKERAFATDIPIYKLNCALTFYSEEDRS